MITGLAIAFITLGIVSFLQHSEDVIVEPPLEPEVITPRTLEITEINPNEYAFKTLDDSESEVRLGLRDNRPNLELEKWNEDVKFNLTMPYEAVSEAENGGNRLTWQTKTENPGEHREVIFSVLKPTERTEEINGRERSFTQHKDGGVKFDIILQEEPSSNVFEFNIDSENLNFYYQEILTEEEMEEQGVFRPENVMGSYAVYHSHKRNNEYKTGKAFHIYRPLIYDANGEEIWGKLNVDKKASNLSVTVDEDWLSQATYPVTVDPTFGNTTQGSSYDERNSAYDKIFNLPPVTVEGVSEVVFEKITGEPSIIK